MERIAASVWLLACLFLIYIAQDLDAPYSYEPLGPKPFPLLLLIIMSICSILLIGKKPKNTAKPGSSTTSRRFICVVGLLAFGLSIEWLGFLIASFLLAWLQAVLYGGSLLKGAIGAAIISLFSYCIFEYVLDVPLPMGLLEPWLY